MFWIDNIRALAMFAIILVHIVVPLVRDYGSIPNTDWWFANILYSTIRFGSPIFLMITGALILPKDYKLSEFLKKRVTRIILPFLFWSLIYIAYKLILKWSNDVEMSIIEIIKYIILNLKDGAFYHLWYIYMLIGIYLIRPIFHK